MAETDNDPKDMWGLRTNQFIPVSVMCYSPNYWDEQQGIGHQHLFFMLKDCVNPEEPNGYYNEFLKPELEQHRRVFEALGAKAHVKDTDDQLSGIGFSLTKRNDLIVKVNGEKKFFARPGTLKDKICVKITDVYDEMHELLRNYF